MPDTMLSGMAIFALALMPVLVAVGYYDLRYLRIPNGLSLIVVAIFVASCAVAVPPDLSARMAVSALVFAAGFTAFAFGLVGAGDVKILASLMLFIPVAGLRDFAGVFAGLLSLLIVLLLAVRQTAFARSSSWKGLSDRRGLPLGVPIAAAGLHTLTALVLVFDPAV